MYSVCIKVETLLKVVNYYDMSVLSMSVMGYQKNLDRGWVGGVSSIQVYFMDSVNFSNFAMPVSRQSMNNTRERAVN